MKQKRRQSEAEKKAERSRKGSEVKQKRKRSEAEEETR
jgi:hypothetical protein